MNKGYRSIRVVVSDLVKNTTDAGVAGIELYG